MEFAYSLGGGPAVFKEFVIGESMATAGVPVTIPGAGETGLHLATTTSLADAVGVTLDTATYTTTQSTDGSDIERRVKVVCNPLAVFRVKLSGGATENTALTLHTVDTASTSGLSVETDNDFASTTMDEGVVWGYTGANAGLRRKITSVSGNHATVIVPFHDISVGDTFLKAPYWFVHSDNVQLTTNLYQADATIAVGTGGAARVVDMELNDASRDGRTNSYIYMYLEDHVFGARPT